MNIGSLIATIGGDPTPLQNSLKQAETAMDAANKNMAKSVETLDQSFKRVGQSMQDFGKKASLYLTAPIVAAGGYAIKMASDYNESINKVEVAFKDNAKEVKSWAKTTLKSFGIAEGTALDMAALFGDMSTSMGMSTEAAAKMSTNLVGLAGDLASFKNIGIEQAVTALNGVFTGETESLKRLGVVMTEDNLKMFAISNGIKKNIQDMTQAEKVNLRYAYVISQTKNAQGDFLRTQGGAANQMRIFQESLKQLGEVFGQVILPYFTKILIKVNEWIQAFSQLSPVTKKIILVLAGVAAAIGPLSIGLGAFLKIIPAIAAGGKLIMSGWFPVIAVITAVAGAFFLVKKWQDEAVKAADEISDIYAGRPLANLEKSLVGEQERLKLLEEELNVMQRGADKVSGWFGGTDRIKQTQDQIRYLEMAIEKKKQAIEKEKEFQEDLKKTNVIAGELPTVTMPGLGQIGAGIEVTTPGDDVPQYIAFNLIKPMEAVHTNFLGIKQDFLEVKKVMAEALPTRGMSDILQYSNAVYEYTSVIRNGLTNTFKEVRAVVVDLNAAIEELAEKALVSLAESIGNIATGGSLKDAMNNLMVVVGDWAIQLGSTMIAAGVAMTEFWTAIVEEPWLAIGIGAALVAVGAMVKNAASNNPTLNSGGYSGGAGSSEGVDLSTNRELLQFDVNVTGQTYVRGSDLVTVFNNENNRKNL